MNKQFHQYKLVPVEPTAEMVEAAKDAYMPFGDMDIALRMALLAAPAVQGEPVAYLRKDQLRQVHRMGSMLGEIADSPRVDRVPVYTAPQPAEQQPELAKYQPCGCVICTCEHETQCQGCGARHCGTHPLAQFYEPTYQQPAPDVGVLVEALDLALEYWRDRQQRYKNRRPKWVIAAESALAAYRKQQENK